METTNFIFSILLILVATKAMIIGSNFNFYRWFKRGKEYLREYEDWIEKAPR